MTRDQVDEYYLTVAEVAELLRLNQQTVRNWIDQGSLPALRVGRRVRIKRSDLDRLLSEGYTAGAHGAALDAGPNAEDFWGGEPVGVAEPATGGVTAGAADPRAAAPDTAAGVTVSRPDSADTAAGVTDSRPDSADPGADTANSTAHRASAPADGVDPTGDGSDSPADGAGPTGPGSDSSADNGEPAARAAATHPAP